MHNKSTVSKWILKRKTFEEQEDVYSVIAALVNRRLNSTTQMKNVWKTYFIFRI